LGERLVGFVLSFKMEMGFATEHHHVAPVRLAQNTRTRITDIFKYLCHDTCSRAALPEAGEETQHALVRIGQTFLVPLLL
jgi:hypothetical protein